MIRSILIVGAAVVATSASFAAPVNLLIITADDMNADSPGFMGNPYGATPNLDKFAAGAVRFERCHVTAPICQPSRSAIMTGRVPHRNGALGFNPIRTNVPTLVEVMRDHGYFTAAIHKIAHMVPKEKFPWDMPLEGSQKNPPAFGRDVAQCIAAAKAKGKPFFINANAGDPHRPFPGSNQKNAEDKGGATPSKVYKPDQIKVPTFLEDIPDVRKEVAQYYTGCGRFDRCFGEAMDALTQSGHADDTLVVYLSDHGMSFPFSKATVYRNGTWSPVLFRGPKAKPLVDRTHFVSSVDIMPTILELLELAGPPGMDGRSLVPLTGKDEVPWPDHVFTHVNTVSSGKSFPQRCVRTATHSYMWMSWPDGKPQFKVEAMSGLSFNALNAAAKSDERIAGRIKQLLVGEREQLFDLQLDPDERKNRLNDPAYADELTRLRKLMLDQMQRTGDPQLLAFQKTLAEAAK
jgi:N-sulfoglucosamine sulfohydrolase